MATTSTTNEEALTTIETPTIHTDDSNIAVSAMRVKNESSVDNHALVTAAEAITRSFLSAEAERARRPLKRKKRQCGCALGETCHRCRKCLEKHCSCGDRVRHRALCLESRACNCLLVTPTARCELCYGCRRTEGYSHCRCEQHEKQRLRTHALAAEARRNDSQQTKTAGDAVATRSNAGHDDQRRAQQQCQCFSVSADVIPNTCSERTERSMRIRRLRRAIGVPSIEDRFAKKISTSLCEDDDPDDGVVDSTREIDSVQSVLHRPLVKRMFPADTYTPPYRQLYLRDGTSFLESIEPREQHERPFTVSRVAPVIASKITTRDALPDIVTPEQLERGLSNALYAKARERAMPSDALVDYLVHAVSIKVASASEMVGTFDDSAAIAAAIVVEEYAAQLVADLVDAEEHDAHASGELTRAGVQEFATHLLQGFDWSRACRLQSARPLDELPDEQHSAAVASAIYDELAIVARLDEVQAAAPDAAEVLQWIHETVEQHIRALQNERSSAAEQRQHAAAAAAKAKATASDRRTRSTRRGVAPAARNLPAPHVRVGVRPHELLGHPTYHVTVESRLPSDQLVRVALNHLETQEQALARVEALKDVLIREHARLEHAASAKQSAAAMQQLLSAELERPTGRAVAKLSSHEKHVVEMQDPEKRRKFERRRQQQALWMQQHRMKQRLENPELAQKHEAYKRKVAASQQRKAKAAETVERRKAAKHSTSTPTQGTEDPVVDALFEQLRQQVRATAGESAPVVPKRPRGRPRKIRDEPAELK